MATTPTTIAEPAITLTPPDPVPVVAPEKAVGLVPVSDENKSKLEQKAEAFVADLVASDANSPEFGQKVDQLTNMGRKEIAAASGQSNRFLDRPIRAMDKDGGVGANLAAKVALDLPNSRTAEKEADQIGMELAVRAGFDPDAAVTLWQKMAAQGKGSPPQFLSTHPAPGNREADLAAMIPAMRKLNPTGKLAAVHPVQIVR